VAFLIDEFPISAAWGMRPLCLTSNKWRYCESPQGILYGANALGGLIKVKRLRDPRPQFEMLAEGTAADYGTGALGGAIGRVARYAGPIAHFALSRRNIAATDFVRMSFCTAFRQRFDELSSRAKIHVDLGTEWRLDLRSVRRSGQWDDAFFDRQFVHYSFGSSRSRCAALEAIGARFGYLGCRVTIESISTYNAIRSALQLRR